MSDQERIRILRIAIRECAAKFLFYEECNLNKTPPDEAKAIKNRMMVDRCNEALELTKDDT